ncbi:VOC family protein [Kribbella speibonae]|uniref:VOC family protein n=1 Tax=Kribbella speibonae TaxID=1572660 RepID=A0A4R0J349_9ACTN|nr:VOC family protein [Kribbella speibonae]TCC40871.1 VOC family protein [Kribbella speibonae]
MLRGLATISFYADDMKAARAWYEKLLGIEAYYNVPNAEEPAYVEFRFGDFQCELGIVDSRYAHQQVGTPAGAIVHWHVDDLEAELDRLVELGATVLEGIVERGTNSGFRTAFVVDPFGNIIGIMNNPHYLEILEELKA